MDDKEEVIICLHKYGGHEHLTMMNPNKARGNGLLLYFRTNKMDLIHDNVTKIGNLLDEEIKINPIQIKESFH